MEINTYRFGKVHIEDDTVLTFKDGMYGFDNLKKFAVINCKETDPIYWLQSVEDGDVALPIIDPFVIKDDYVIDVDDKELESIGTEHEEDIIVYNVAVLPKDITQITVNLVAPIIINISNNQARQVVLGLDQENAIKYPAFAPLMKYYKEVEKGASSDKENR